MAKITQTPTGRPSTSYKSKYLELKDKYEKLLEVKVGLTPAEAPKILNDDTKSSEVNASIDDSSSQTSKAKSEEALEGVAEENLIETPEEPSMKEQKPEEAKMESDQLELEQAEIEIEPAKANPNDFDFRCSDCKELFMEEGNKVEGGIKCPDCGKVYSNG